MTSIRFRFLRSGETIPRIKVYYCIFLWGTSYPIGCHLMYILSRGEMAFQESANIGPQAVTLEKFD